MGASKRSTLGPTKRQAAVPRCYRNRRPPAGDGAHSHVCQSWGGLSSWRPPNLAYGRRGHRREGSPPHKYRRRDGSALIGLCVVDASTKMSSSAVALVYPELCASELQFYGGHDLVLINGTPVTVKVAHVSPRGRPLRPVQKAPLGRFTWRMALSGGRRPSPHKSVLEHGLAGDFGAGHPSLRKSLRARARYFPSPHSE